MFNFRRLDVYGCAISFFKLAIPLIERTPTGYHSLADQLRRAAVSIPLNIGRGGKPSKRVAGADRFDAHQALHRSLDGDTSPTPTPTQTPTTSLANRSAF